jgi:hypothetical protein
MFELPGMVPGTGLPRLGELSAAVEAMLRLRRHLHQERRPGIRAVSHWTCNAQASDPGDKIFSLLGMIEVEEKSLVGSEYGLTATQVFARATDASIAVQGSLGIIKDIRLRRAVTSRGSALSQLPTWAFNFLQQQNYPISRPLPAESYSHPESTSPL